MTSSYYRDERCLHSWHRTALNCQRKVLHTPPDWMLSIAASRRHTSEPSGSTCNNPGPRAPPPLLPLWLPPWLRLPRFAARAKSGRRCVRRDNCCVRVQVGLHDAVAPDSTRSMLAVCWAIAYVLGPLQQLQAVEPNNIHTVMQHERVSGGVRASHRSPIWRVSCPMECLSISCNSCTSVGDQSARLLCSCSCKSRGSTATCLFRSSVSSHQTTARLL
jgi:hypothetical protein